MLFIVRCLQPYFSFSRIGTVRGTPIILTSPSVSRTLSWCGCHASTFGYVHPSTSSTSIPMTMDIYVWITSTKPKLWVMGAHCSSFHRCTHLFSQWSEPEARPNTRNVWRFESSCNSNFRKMGCCGKLNEIILFIYSEKQMFKLRKRYNLKTKQNKVILNFFGSNTSLKNFHVSRCVGFPLLKIVRSRLGAESCCRTFEFSHSGGWVEAGEGSWYLNASLIVEGCGPNQEEGQSCYWPVTS